MQPLIKPSTSLSSDSLGAGSAQRGQPCTRTRTLTWRTNACNNVCAQAEASCSALHSCSPQTPTATTFVFDDSLSEQTRNLKCSTTMCLFQNICVPEDSLYSLQPGKKESVLLCRSVRVKDLFFLWTFRVMSCDWRQKVKGFDVSLIHFAAHFYLFSEPGRLQPHTQLKYMLFLYSHLMSNHSLRSYS